MPSLNASLKVQENAAAEIASINEEKDAKHSKEWKGWFRLYSSGQHCIDLSGRVNTLLSLSLSLSLSIICRRLSYAKCCAICLAYSSSGRSFIAARQTNGNEERGVNECERVREKDRPSSSSAAADRVCVRGTYRDGRGKVCLLEVVGAPSKHRWD